jgi:chromosome segregation ATPase
MCELAKKHDKQFIATTHNPAILDGLNLYDDEVRLFRVYRDNKGATRTERIKLKPPTPDGQQLKLSELWTRGYLGAISQNF